MKTLLAFFLLVTLSCASQVDTIYLRNGRVIACKILKLKQESLKYRVYGQWDQWVDLTDIERYSDHDERTTKPGKNRKVHAPALKADTLTPLEAEVKRNSKTIERIQLNLRRSHEQFNTGLILMGAGVGVAAIAGFTEGDTQTVLLGIAGGIGLVGLVNTLASHRWINRAGTPLSGR